MTKVSVLMSVYNAGEYLDQAIQSILNQTFSDFEFIIINDVSTDGSANYLKQLSDPRVKLIHNEKNIGLTCSLNVGLKHVTSEYVARMDADDVATPRRLEKQVQFLDENPDYVLVGSSYRLINENSEVIETVVKPMDDTELRWIFHTRTALEHGSVTYRLNMKGKPPIFYDEKYRTAQDYDFWLQMLANGKGLILPDLFLDYRIHSNNITSTLSNQQMTNLKNISLNFLNHKYSLTIEDEKKVLTLVNFVNNNETYSVEEFKDADSGLTILFHKFCQTQQLTNSERAYIRQRAKGQLWHAAINKKPVTLMQKCLLPILFPSAFFTLLQKQLNHNAYLQTTLLSKYEC
jgi:glycosyltransferase involved in cell wall biosynthesis